MYKLVLIMFFKQSKSCSCRASAARHAFNLDSTFTIAGYLQQLTPVGSPSVELSYRFTGQVHMASPFVFSHVESSSHLR